VLLVVALSALFVGYLYQADLTAKWSVFDDHGIMYFVGTAERLGFSQIIPKWLETEVSPQATIPRYRPVAFLFRLVECWAWGKQPVLWHLGRLAILVAFISCAWLLAWSRIGAIPSALLAIYTVTFSYWADIFTALGPSEAYAVLGVAVYLIGLDQAYSHPEFKRGWITILVGTVIAAGAKENFGFLMMPPCLLLAYALRTKRVSWAGWPSVGLGVLWCLWIAWVVVGRMRALGNDYYSGSIGMRDRLLVFMNALQLPQILLLFAAGMGFALLWICWRGRQSRLQHASAVGVVVVVLLLASCILQVVFYNGRWPTATRYDFPGMLFAPALLLLVIWYAQQYRAALPISSALNSALVTGIVLIGVLAAASNGSSISTVRRLVERNAHSTAAFTALMDRLSGLAISRPGVALVIQSNDPADFEQLRSYPRFISASGAPNNTYLLWIPRRPAVTNYAGSISDQLTQMSQQGVPGQYLPFAGLHDENDGCILVVISGPPRWPCEVVVDADWRPFY